MLGSFKIAAFVGTTEPSRAKVFYRDVLGLRLVDEDGFALVFDANGINLRISTVGQVAAAEYTVLGWEVPDINSALHTLQGAGVKFERYEGFMEQDELGIWTAPSGTRVAWFKDPDGNVLSIAEHQH